jgi:excisionase family DNA binding protein
MASSGEFMFIRRAALELCCTEKHVYRMIHDGKLEAIRIGTRGIRVSRESVMKYILRNRVLNKES